LELKEALTYKDKGARVRATSVTPQRVGPTMLLFSFEITSRASCAVSFFSIIILWERYH